MAKDHKRSGRIDALYMSYAAEFLEKESSGFGLLTVTDVSISRDRKTVTILFTVFPDKYEEQAIRFAKRKRSEFRDYVRDRSDNHLAFLPMFDFEIDSGEKNRQKIDELIRRSK